MFPREKQDRQTGSTQTSTRRVSSRLSLKTSRRAVSSDVKNDSNNHHSSKKLATRTYLLTPPYYHLETSSLGERDVQGPRHRVDPGQDLFAVVLE